MFGPLEMRRMLQFYIGSLGQISLRRWHLGTYLKEKRELAKQTCRVFKVSVVGLRNERRIMGDEVRWIMENHIIQGLVEHLNDYGFWGRWGTLGEFEKGMTGSDLCVEWVLCWKEIVGVDPLGRLLSCRSGMVVSWMSVIVKVVTSRWSWEWSCLNFPTVLDRIWKTGVKDNSSSIKMIKAVGDQFGKED